MRAIEAVIFDWGGVLIANPTANIIAYCARALGVPENEYRNATAAHIAGFQKGAITEQGFWERVCRHLGRVCPGRSLWGEAFRAAYAPIEEVFSLAAALHRSGYKLGVLSNTEAPCIKFFHEPRYAIFGVKVLSCEAGAVKPEDDIYRIALQRLGTEAAKTVFIDDVMANVAGAKDAGMKGILFKNPAQVEKELDALGVRLGGEGS